jgi:beta-lactamase class A
MMHQKHAEFWIWVGAHKGRITLAAIAIVSIVSIVVQLVYPGDKLLPFQSVDSVLMSGWSKADAIKSLDATYNNTPVAIYFGLNNAAFRTPTPSALGMHVDASTYVNSIEYPLYMRLIPTSIYWAHRVVTPHKPVVYARDSAVLAAYIKKELGESCSIAPKDAGVTVKDNKLTIVESEPGGTCKISDVTKTLADVTVSAAHKPSATVPFEIVPADVNDTDAQNVADQIADATKNGVNVDANGQVVVLPKDSLLSWLNFAVINKKLDYSFDTAKANDYATAQLGAKVAAAAGVTTVATYDFVETSRQTGASGKALDVGATLARVKTYIDGTLEKVVAATTPVAPSIVYTRTYSPTDVGLSALMQNYASSHPGTYGVALTELSGKYRRATYNGDMSFTTASTYKLFIAYSTLMRIESGVWHWSDQVQGGRDLTKCFDDMIVVSDNECAKALLQKIGYTTITNEMKAAGLVHTSFLGNDGIKTVPSDLALLLAMLQSGQILNQQSTRDILISAMKRNIYRQGIPRGVAGIVADKVGFLDALLHDAGIVYASSGTYVLVIMTDGASWANIAELTRQIESLRIQ